jgi:hypothetical protein
MRCATKVWAVLAVLAMLGTMPARAQDSNRNEVRGRVAEGGWEIVWGELVNEAEYAKMVAALYTGSPEAYFSDYLDRTIARVQRTAPDVGKQAILNAMQRAFRDNGRSFQLGKVGVKAGIATYQRWNDVIVDVPDGVERYRIDGPFGTWTYGYRPRMKRVERRIPLPNHHQPYVGFRIYPG